ncbi:MAG: DUF530 family protein [Candidatus Burarchaeum sp.]|nr:DUF530 family protein [Candidatus Burarchaeum sp.]MDO8339518.1 DUF530 family protein [Candidatus Burarchaeum sp.]
MLETSSSASLIAQANKFMDAIAEPARVDEALQTIDELERFKEEMRAGGFSTPFTGAGDAKKSEELEEAELSDLKKQLRKMKDLANAKKFTLNRLMVAIAANKIAARLLERGGSEALKTLPLGGNYIAQLVKHGEHAVHAYSVLLETLAAAGSELERSVLVTIERDVGGKKVQEKIRLLSDQKIEERVRRAYGAAARVVSTEVRTAQDSLVRSKGVRACVASAYSALASAKAAQEFDAELRKNSKLSGYVEVLSKNGMADLNALEDDDDKYFRIMEQLAEKGLAAKGKEGYVLGEGLADAVEERRKWLKASAARTASEALALDLFRYYMSTPVRKRESAPIFPTLSASLSLKQVRMFGPVSRALGVTDAGALLLEKIDSEPLSAGIKGDLFGAALFLMRSEKKEKWCAEFFRVGEDELYEARGKVEALLSGGERAKKFMELVKGARDKGKQQAGARSSGKGARP